MPRKQKQDGVIYTCDSFLHADSATKLNLASFPGRSPSRFNVPRPDKSRKPHPSQREEGLGCGLRD